MEKDGVLIIQIAENLFKFRPFAPLQSIVNFWHQPFILLSKLINFLGRQRLHFFAANYTAKIWTQVVYKLYIV